MLNQVDERTEENDTVPPMQQRKETGPGIHIEEFVEDPEDSNIVPCEQSFNVDMSHIQEDNLVIDIQGSKDNEAMVAKESTQPETSEDEKHSNLNKELELKGEEKFEDNSQPVSVENRKRPQAFNKHQELLEDRGGESTRPLYNNYARHSRQPSSDMDISKRSHMELIIPRANIRSDQVDYYVERRYCMACNLEQPLRSRHCKDCKRCVAMFDHHCPWLGTCIGEKNHGFFLIYLFFQNIQLIAGLYQTIMGIIHEDKLEEKESITKAIKIVVLLFIIFFTFMVISLLLYHSYLLLINLTTWEHASWYKISYLKEFNEDDGSPFSQGCTKNVRLICCESQKPGHINWQYTRPPPKAGPVPQSA